MMVWANAVIQGVLAGGLYALMAVGLSLAFGIMRLVNIAHGDLTVLAAFIALSLATWLGVGNWVVLILLVPLMGLLGYLLQRSLLNRVLGSDLLPPLLMTFGLSIMIQSGLLQVYSADTRSLPSGTLTTESFSLGGGLQVGVLPLLVLGVAVLVFVLLQGLFRCTRLGRAFRAAADDPHTIRLMGVDNRHVYALAMGLAMAVTALGGFFFVLGGNVGPAEGGLRLIYAFEAVIIGGLGSLWGTLLGALVLGVAQSIALQLNPGWGILGGHLAFLLVLAFRPQGLFPVVKHA
ncbi:branched-chain amino acid ABC transporter permease [Castellaniella defragrans]|uniref:branched-chain amino acid ABC transporter permease n=1 Tax=Castellaniella defragrans TaxID=75697 RepID=UPI002AFFA94D|nr:branched-chain amino acid ABC transporter permease [Castellaniella defragrans]